MTSLLSFQKTAAVDVIYGPGQEKCGVKNRGKRAEETLFLHVRPFSPDGWTVYQSRSVNRKTQKSRATTSANDKNPAAMMMILPGRTVRNGFVEIFFNVETLDFSVKASQNLRILLNEINERPR